MSSIDSTGRPAAHDGAAAGPEAEPVASEPTTDEAVDSRAADAEAVDAAPARTGTAEAASAESEPGRGGRLLPRLTARGIELAWAFGALLVTAAVSYYRLTVVRSARYPGHADPAFTFGVAQNIRAGRGQNIDYIWHYLIPNTPLHHYAFDYWLPLPSELMAVALHVRQGLPGALEMNIAMSVLLTVGTYALARSLTDRTWVPAISAVVVLVQPVVTMYSVQAESAVYLGAFAVPAMAAAIYARRSLAWWPVAGIFAALATMSRSEGLILSAVIGLAALGWAERGRWFSRAGLFLAGLLPVAAPYFLANLSHFGSPIPPVASTFPYITNYLNLYALHNEKSLHALLGGGLHAFVDLRASAVNAQLVAAFQTTTPLVSLLILLLVGGAVFGALREVPRAALPLRLLRSDWLVPAGFLVLVFAFDALIAPVVAGAGAVIKVMLTGSAVLLVAAFVQLGRAVRSRTLIALICLAMFGFPLLPLASRTREVVAYNNSVGTSQAQLAGSLHAEQACLGRAVVMMTSNPWEFNQATGFAAVQLPSGSLADILATASRYGATDIENLDSRPATANLPALEAPGGPFAPATAFGARQIYRIKATTAGAHC